MFNSESHASICVTGPSRKSSACLPPINANKAREADQRSANTRDGSEEDHDSLDPVGEGQEVTGESLGPIVPHNINNSV